MDHISENQFLNDFLNSKNDIDRFDHVRRFLDLRLDNIVSDNILEIILADQSDIIRSELADYLIVAGGLAADNIFNKIKIENSVIVYPKLWLALSIRDRLYLKEFQSLKIDVSIMIFEKAYFDAAMFKFTEHSSYIYDLCAIAFGSDVHASYTAIDLLSLVAADYPELLRNLAVDLERDGAENAEKAKQLLIFSK